MAEGKPLRLGPRPAASPVLAVCGVLSGDEALAARAVETLAAAHGGVLCAGPLVAFSATRYYEPELGAALSRRYVAFSELLAPEPAALVAFKQETWALEQQLAAGDGKRRVNLDPGTLDATKVVLASFKVGPQKLYLGQSVWADPVLWYADGAFQRLPWTFPDLRGDAHLPFFADARGRYKALARAQRARLARGPSTE